MPRNQTTAKRITPTLPTRLPKRSRLKYAGSGRSTVHADGSRTTLGGKQDRVGIKHAHSPTIPTLCSRERALSGWVQSVDMASFAFSAAAYRWINSPRRRSHDRILGAAPLSGPFSFPKLALSAVRPNA
jgi:hypothetical protein